MSLAAKLLKNSKVKETAMIGESKVFGKKEMVPTTVPMVNVALSGRLDGGMVPGMLMLAGPSKHFKSAFALMMAASFLKKHKDGVILFYDSEFGSPESYFESFGIDMEKVVHTPIMNLEELKFDLVNQLEGIDKGDKVFVLVDSIGNLASKKELDDAMDEKSVADMTRAKQMKSVWRMVTPYLSLKDIPLVAINHTYKEIGLFPKDIVSGGTGAYYSSDAVWIIGRRQEKTGTEVTGYDFVINIDKSRHVREKSAIPISVTFEGGIKKWSGLLEVAEEAGYFRKPKKGWYEWLDAETGELLSEKSYRKKEIEESAEIWKHMFTKTKFPEYVKNKFTIGGNPLMAAEPDEVEENEE